MKDILLHLAAHPGQTSPRNVDRAVAIAAGLGAGITGLSCEIDVRVRRTLLSDLLIDLEELAAGERARSRERVRDLVACFEDAAGRHGLARHTVVHRCTAAEVADVLVARARLADLTILPLAAGDSEGQYLVEAVAFGAGRPLLVLPEPTDDDDDDEAILGAGLPEIAFDHIGIAWDFGRPAARALADAMPLLVRAKVVKLAVVTGDKPEPRWVSIADVEHHLARQGLDVIVEEIPADGRDAGDVLASFARVQALDLLVMGAWGQSRMREFVLGGATRSLLRAPPVPLLMSH